MFVTKARTTIIVVFTFITLIQSYVATVTMAASSAAVNTSDPLEITCTVSALSDAVVYYKEGIEVGRCAKPSIPGLPGLCVNGFSQNRTTQITTYNIISANATNDEGTWTCTHTTETSNTLGIKVYGFPTNPIDDNQAYLMNNIDTTTMDSTQLTVNVSECVNPAPTISWIFFQDCDGMSIAHIPITSTISIDADVTCSKLYSAYKSMVTVTDMKNAVGGGNYCYKVQSVVQYPGLSFQSKTVVFLQNITFTSPTATTEMSSSSTSKDQTTSSQNPSIAFFHNTQKTETTIMTTTDIGLTSASLRVSSEVTTPIKTESNNSTELGFVISGVILLFLIITLVICCCQYYRKKSKKTTSDKFEEIHNNEVPKFSPNVIGKRYGFNGTNGSIVHITRDRNHYQDIMSYNLPSTHQSDNYECSRSDRENITETRKHQPKQVQEKIGHGFPKSTPDDIINRYDKNGIQTFALHDYTRTYYSGKAVSSPRRFEHRGAYFPDEYNNHNRRSFPYMTQLQLHVPRDLEGLTFYQGQNRATNK